MVAASIMRIQNIGLVFAPTANKAACQKIMDNNWRSFAGQTCTDTGLFIPMRANYKESHDKATKWQRAYYGTTIHSYNFALIEITNAAMFNELASTLFPGALNCQKKISWRTSVYPDTGVGNLLGTDALPSVTDTCIYNSPRTSILFLTNFSDYLARGRNTGFDRLFQGCWQERETMASSTRSVDDG